MKTSLLALSALAAAVPAAHATIDRQAMLDQQKFCSSVKDAATRAKCFETLTATMLRATEAPATPPAPPAPPPSPYAALIAAGKANITTDLKDPSSAKFRNLFIGGEKALPALCGEIAAKNSYGAYTGFKRFYATTEKLLSEIEQPTVAFNTMYRKMCEPLQEAVE